MPILTAQWILPIDAEPIHNGYLEFEHGRITALGSIEEMVDSKTISGKSYPTPRLGSIITPGLVNTHMHLEQTFARPILKTAQQTFTDWLVAVIETTRHANTPGKKLKRCQKGVRELLQAGTTCVNDIASGPESLQALEQGGLRGIVSLECFHPAFHTVHIDGIVEVYHRLQNVYTGHARLQVGLSPHSPYNVSPAAWQALLDACQPRHLHTHVAEFDEEAAYLQGQASSIAQLHTRILGQQYSPQESAESPVQYLNRWNLLNPQTILAHCVHTSVLDREIIKASGAKIAHCPRSNLVLHGKTLQASSWEAYPEVIIALGTDGRLSTEDLDLRAEARAAMQLHAWSAKHALRAITLHGAQVLGLEKEIGSLTPGKCADLVLWQYHHPDHNANESKSLSSEAPETQTPEAWLLSEATQAESVYIEGVLRWQSGQAEDSQVLHDD